MFNPSDLQCLIIFLLAEISFHVSDGVTSAFKTKTAIMNPIAIITFFSKICKAIFDHFLTIESSKGGFFRPLSTYFGIVETNVKDILPLYCLVWLKDITNLSNF